jgi:hypothetical protein
MQSFRTTFDIPIGNQPMDYSSKVLLLGSCFAENMGEKLLQNKFQTLINPFGILYNPDSIANSLEILIKKKKFTERDLFEDNGVWNSFSHHSRFSDTNKDNCLENINQQIEVGAAFLKQADYLIITFGTAWVYQLKKTGKVVSNCHKVHAKEFDRYRISKCDIVEKCKSVFKKLKNQNLNLKIILTVSPVRHIKDGLIENQLSKATLLLAIHEMVAEFEKVIYFPSYEIMMDDLRDYRFYADDMLHPSPLAIEYIWEKFKNSWIDPEVFGIMKEISKIQQAMNHKPFFTESDSHQLFLKNQVKNIQLIMEQHPGIDLADEKEYFKKQLMA